MMKILKKYLKKWKKSVFLCSLSIVNKKTSKERLVAATYKDNINRFNLRKNSKT